MLTRDKNIILVIVAHPDDETLGLGGTILKHKKKGDHIYGIYMTNGISSRINESDEKIIERRTAADKVGKLLGIKWCKRGVFPDNAMDSVSLIKVIKFIEEIKNKINPNLIYTHSHSDLNVDHKIVNEATITAFRPKAGECWEEIRLFEVPSSTDYGHKTIRGNFNPNLYINIEKEIDSKIEILSHYDCELLPSPNSRSLEMLKILSQYRGSQVGLKFAEAFEVIRKIER